MVIIKKIGFIITLFVLVLIGTYKSYAQVQIINIVHISFGKIIVTSSSASITIPITTGNRTYVNVVPVSTNDWNRGSFQLQDLYTTGNNRSITVTVTSTGGLTNGSTSIPFTLNTSTLPKTTKKGTTSAVIYLGGTLNFNSIPSDGTYQGTVDITVAFP